jgi:uncharacterized protein with LGFP repeats
MSDLASLLERLRGPHRRSECGNFAEVHPDCLNEAASRISTLERELEEARATNEQLRGETYLASAEAAEFHRDNAVTMWDAERARATAAEAKVARMGEALKPFADAADSYDPDEGDDRHAAWAHDFTIGSLRRARSALQSEKDREGQP